LIRKAIVLAAGRGTRMGGLTENLPKPMLPIAGKPMLEHIVDRLRGAGIDDILVAVGYRREVIEAHFPSLNFVTQEVVEGTAAAVKLGQDFAGREPFLLTFGDILCDAGNYSGIAEMFARRNAAAVIGVKRVDDPWQGAAVYADESGRVSQIVEKPAPGTSATNWNSAGLYAFAPIVFDEIDRVKKSPRGEYEITSAIEQLIAACEPVFLFEMHGAWKDVGRPEDLDAAAGILSSA
jgi:dTDP-glucose pyrophosphorylase